MKEIMRPTCQFFIIMSVILTLSVTGCVTFLNNKNEAIPVSQEEYARKCYRQGLIYLDNSRYELARQQFSFAAASATSKEQYLEAVGGIQRVDKIIKQKR